MVKLDFDYTEEEFPEDEGFEPLPEQLVPLRD